MATLAQEQLDRSRLVEHEEHVLDDSEFYIASIALLAGNAIIRFPSGQSFTMVPHAVAFANALYRNVGADSYGTYAGHSPTPERAIDTFSSVPSDRRAPGTPGLRRVLGDDVADFAVASMRNGNPYGLDYFIWRQHIFNPDIADYWRAMEDRDGVTNNHFDHGHSSFNVSASGLPYTPPTTREEDAMSLAVRYIYEDKSKKGPDGKNERLDWVFDGPSRIWAPVGTADVLRACDKAGLAEVGEIGKDGHDWFAGRASTW